MLFKSKRSEPQEAPGAPFEDECGELSDNALETIYGGKGFAPDTGVKICENAV